jgi:hypothetical protein
MDDLLQARRIPVSRRTVALLHPNCVAIRGSIDVKVFRKSTGQLTTAM